MSDCRVQRTGQSKNIRVKDAVFPGHCIHQESRSRWREHVGQLSCSFRFKSDIGESKRSEQQRTLELNQM